MLKNGRYASIKDVTDLVGVRIILYYEDEVVTVSKLLESNFLIDEVNSINKNKMLDPDRFGYLSNHLICSFSSNRSRLPEYSVFGGIRFEIQVRSVLQHAWAEIEHDLGYKNKREIPSHLIRRFNRISGLLELADNEFIEIRSKINDYTKIVDKKINEDNIEVEINLVTMRIFSESKRCRAHDIFIYKLTGLHQNEQVNEHSVKSNVALCQYLEIKTINKLDTLLIEHHNEIVKFAEIWLQRPSGTEGDEEGEDLGMDAGISIFYLGYWLATRELDYDKALNYMKIHNFFPGPDVVAREAIATAEEVLRQLKDKKIKGVQ